MITIMMMTDMFCARQLGEFGNDFRKCSPHSLQHSRPMMYSMVRSVL
jgi:hypothetical protein